MHRAFAVHRVSYPKFKIFIHLSACQVYHVTDKPKKHLVTHTALAKKSFTNSPPKSKGLKVSAGEICLS